MAGSHCDQLDRKCDWAWVQGAAIPGWAGTAYVPLAFFVENYCAVVNLPTFLPRHVWEEKVEEEETFQDAGQ